MYRLGAFGPFLVALWVSWAVFVPLGPFLGALGPLLGAFGLLGRSWALLGHSWALFGRSWPGRPADRNPGFQAAGCTGLKCNVLEPEVLPRGRGGANTLKPRLPPYYPRAASQDLKVLDLRH